MILKIFYFHERSSAKSYNNPIVERLSINDMVPNRSLVQIWSVRHSVFFCTPFQHGGITQVYVYRNFVKNLYCHYIYIYILRTNKVFSGLPIVVLKQIVQPICPPLKDEK